MTGDDAISLPGALAATRFGDVRWVAETGSTNHDALALARQGEHEGVVCVADHQTRGRGRRDRTWSAAPGSGLLLSVLLRPPARVAPVVTMAVGVAAADAVRARTGVEALLKWPNDLVVRTVASGSEDAAVDRKLAGILAEADWPAGSGSADGWAAPQPADRVAVVVGVGLNLRWVPAPPDEIAATAVSLEQLAGHPVDSRALLVALLVELEGRYEELVTAGAAALLDAWRERSATLGRRVRVDLGPEDVEGVASDVTPEGNLVVVTDAGERRELAVGDVVHLRDAHAQP